MSFPKLNTPDGIVTVTPDLIRELGKELPSQIKDMSIGEIIELGMAIKELGKLATIKRIGQLISKR